MHNSFQASLFKNPSGIQHSCKPLSRLAVPVHQTSSQCVSSARAQPCKHSTSSCIGFSALSLGRDHRQRRKRDQQPAGPCRAASSCCAGIPPFAAVSNLWQSWQPWAGWISALAAAAAILLAVKRVFDTPSRTYNANVGDVYDDWTDEGVLEYFWGEHIHLGYYSDEEQRKAWKQPIWTGRYPKSFKQAKFDFIDEMLAWSEAEQPATILDVGCGIGGTTRHLAAKFPNAKVTGVTLSPQQVARGTALAKDRGLHNANFQVMDAQAMTFPDNSFDLVWACESGEHMPDKQKYIQEMERVLKPGGKIVIACWCQREETAERPLSPSDKSKLQFLYDEWAHPFFVSYQQFARLLQGTRNMATVDTADWTPQTLPTWRQSIWVGVWDPWIVIFKGPKVWYRTMREIVTIERMHRAFAQGLMQYGMIRGTKAAESSKQQTVNRDSRVHATA